MPKPSRKTKAPPTAPVSIRTDLGQIELVPIGDLKPYEFNARTHSDKQVGQIASSLEGFGWTNPILADAQNVIIAGHGRWLAAQRLRMTEVPVLRIEHLSEDALRAYRIADNQLALTSGWDEEILAIEFQHLLVAEDLDFEIEITGFDQPTIDIILSPPDEDGESKLDPEDRDVPEPTQVAVTRTGDIWLCNGHRLLCGSALEPASFATLMDGKQAVMVAQDSPYNVKISGHVSGMGKTKHREFAMASGEMSDDEFHRFLSSNLAALLPHLVDGAMLAQFMDWRGVFTLQQANVANGLPVMNLGVWVKSNGGMGSLWRSRHELVLLTKKGSAPHINNVELGKHGRYRCNVFHHPGVNTFGKNRMEELGSHPTPKPLLLMADLIRDISHRGQIVIDSFMGSGTTLLAAERTGRLAYGMDIDPLYIDVAVRRWQKMTGQKAVLEASGHTFADVEAERTADAVA